MRHLHTVVVGTDGSDAAAAALAWVVTRVSAGDIHVVYAHHRGGPAIDAGDHHPDGPVEGDDPGNRDLDWQLAGEWTEPVRQAGIEATRHVAEGDPVAALIAMAAEVDADAIAVGAHGSGDKPSNYLGSITRRLLHDSPIPVIVVNPQGSGWQHADRVIAWVGYGETAARAAAWAAAYAADRGFSLTLLHVVSHRPVFPLDSPVDMVGSYLGADVSEAWARAELDSIRDELLSDHPDLDITTIVEHGSTVESVLDAGENADLVVVGKRHEGIVSRHLIGPRLQRLVARGVSPTAVVPSSFGAD